MKILDVAFFSSLCTLMQLFPIMCSSVQFMNWILDLPAYWKGRLSVNNNLNLGILLTQNYHITSAEELKSVSDSIVGMLPKLKRQFTHKYKILSLFTHPHSIPNSCFFPVLVDRHAAVFHNGSFSATCEQDQIIELK